MCDEAVGEEGSAQDRANRFDDKLLEFTERIVDKKEEATPEELKALVGIASVLSTRLQFIRAI